MGSKESHFNVSVGSDGQSHRTVSTNYNLFEEKGEPKWYRTEVLPLTPMPNRLTEVVLGMVVFLLVDVIVITNVSPGEKNLCFCIIAFFC